MYRRLFFLFPDVKEAKKAVHSLMQEGITTKQMHTLSRSGINLDDLPSSAPNQKLDMHTKIENILWNMNLGIFVIALLVLVSAINAGNNFLFITTLLIMTATYWTGYFYLKKPTIHLSDFHAAFAHNEILLMVDVPKDQVVHIEKIIHNKIPAASEEGISWTPSNLSMNI